MGPRNTQTRRGPGESRHDSLCNRRAPRGPIAVSCAALFLLWLVAACGGTPAAEPASGSDAVLEAAVTPVSQAAGPGGAAGEGEPVSLSLAAKGIKLEPLPLRAGFPFTITIPIHNNEPVPAVGVPVMVYLSARQEQIGFSSFFRVMAVTVPATQTVQVTVPVAQNLAGGEYRLWVQANLLSAPIAEQAGTPTLPEVDLEDNSVLLDVAVAPFDAYASDLCPGRVDAAIEFAEIWLEPDLRRLHVRVHNVGNQALYNLPVVVTGGQAAGDTRHGEGPSAEVSGVAYTAAIAPCGGTAEAVVELDRPLEAGDSVEVAVNPEDWPDGLAEDSFDNNHVRSVTLSPDQSPVLLSEGRVGAAGSGGAVVDYDFAISPEDVEIVRSGVVLVKVHNLGTRDAANVPVRIEAKSGRKVVDLIPVVEGNGLGLAAIQLGWLWSPKATLTLIVNPEGAKGAYPETNRDNNVVTFTLQ